jgi:hypothetical protein
VVYITGRPHSQRWATGLLDGKSEPGKVLDEPGEFMNGLRRHRFGKTTFKFLDRDRASRTVNAQLLGDSVPVVVGRSHIAFLGLARSDHVQVFIT